MSIIIAHNSKNEEKAVDVMLTNISGNAAIFYFIYDEPPTLRSKISNNKSIVPIAYKTVDDLSKLIGMLIEKNGDELGTIVIFASQLATKGIHESKQMSLSIKRASEFNDNTIVLTYTYRDVTDVPGDHWVIPHCARITSKEIIQLVD